jgi:hypothetical protein
MKIFLLHDTGLNGEACFLTLTFTGAHKTCAFAFFLWAFGKMTFALRLRKFAEIRSIRFRISMQAQSKASADQEKKTWTCAGPSAKTFVTLITFGFSFLFVFLGWVCGDITQKRATRNIKRLGTGGSFQG